MFLQLRAKNDQGTGVKVANQTSLAKEIRSGALCTWWEERAGVLLKPSLRKATWNRSQCVSYSNFIREKRQGVMFSVLCEWVSLVDRGGSRWRREGLLKHLPIKVTNVRVCTKRLEGKTVVDDNVPFHGNPKPKQGTYSKPLLHVNWKA